MPGRYTILFPLGLLALLALLTFWIERNVQAPEPRRESNLRHDPDYIVENFVTTRTDINGQLADVLAAVEMRHYPDDDSTDLVRPRMTQYAPGKPWVQVEGQQGRVSSDGEMVEFTKNVRVLRQATADRGEMKVTTEYLKVFPKKDIAMTDKPIVITEAPATVIHAVGMVYNRKAQTLELQSRVRAHYERPASKQQPKAKLDKRQVKSTKPTTTAVTRKKAPDTASPRKRATPNQTSNKTQNTRIRRQYERTAAP